MIQSPLHVNQITPAFLNSILATVPKFQGATIVDVRPEQLAGDSVFNAILLRLYLVFENTRSTSPQSLIAKLPTLQTELYERAVVFQPGLRENWFYTTAAPLSPIRVPNCYYNQTEFSTFESVLILEDLAPAQPGSWLKGTNVGQARVALESLARFHAHWWNQEDCVEIKELVGLLSGNKDDEGNLVGDLFYAAWPRFKIQMKEVLKDEVHRFGDTILGNMEWVDSQANTRQQTLCHGDYRLDNILFGTRDGKISCWVVDWEDVFFGSGLIDVSWFLGGCLPMALSHHESDLLRHYYRTLVDGGVGNYSWEQYFADYRAAMCSSFVQGVLSAVAGEDANEYEQTLAKVVGERFISTAHRLCLSDFVTA